MKDLSAVAAESDVQCIGETHRMYLVRPEQDEGLAGPELRSREEPAHTGERRSYDVGLPSDQPTVDIDDRRHD